MCGRPLEFGGTISAFSQTLRPRGRQYWIVFAGFCPTPGPASTVFSFSPDMAPDFRKKDAQTGAFSDEIHETFVAHPGGSATIQDVQIFDYELASLIESAKPHPQSRLTLIFDSCHSGGLLRTDFGNLDPIDYPAIPRCWIPPEKFATPEMAFWSLAPKYSVRHSAEPHVLSGSLLSDSFLSGNIDVPRLVVAAAQPDQSAWDDKLDDNRRHGVFSYYALQLIRANPKCTWRELIAGAAAKIALKFPQKPLLLGDEFRFGASLWP